MAKKILIISLMIFGMAVGVVNVLAQETNQIQSTSTVPLTASSTPLISSVSVDPATIAEVDLQPGARNPHVKKVQEVLKALGYLPSDTKTTGYFGPQTRKAIKNFQRAQGLAATGFFNSTTRAALKKVLKEGRKEGQVVIDKNVDIACMKTVVEKRENALLTAFDAYSTKLKTTRETRKTDLLAAWSIQDPKERHKAIKAAWDKYRQSVKTATTEWNGSQKEIWLQFVQDAKKCKASAVETVETQDLEKVEVTE